MSTPVQQVQIGQVWRNRSDGRTATVVCLEDADGTSWAWLKVREGQHGEQPFMSRPIAALIKGWTLVDDEPQPAVATATPDTEPPAALLNDLAVAG